LLSIGSKEMAVAIPVATALRSVLLPRPHERPFRAAVAPLAAIALYALLRFGVLGIVPRAPAAAGAGRTALFWTWWSAFTEYLRVLAWPLELSIVSPVALVTSPRSLSVVLGLALFGLAAFASWRLRRRLPIVSWGLACFLASLLPLVNFIVPVRAISSVAFPWAERFLFVPSIFLAIAVGGALAALSGRARTLGLVAVAVVASLFGARTLARERVWSSQRSLFEAAVREHPEDGPARVNLGGALLDAGEAVRAELELRRALEANPADPIAQYLLGNARRAQDDLPAAEAAYRRALALRPVYPQALINLGLTLAARGDLDAAEAAFRSADTQLGGAPETKVNLAIVMRLRGRQAEAATLYREALALDPDFGPAREGLASLSP
ncbi:MAG TPA: tetratricopeptide repeat protein, partial [Candidatus Polarisedimenticolaceae bacterium]|nr:tetratricopeptide repeat protein [Candidatus Polarisedimenticolaceae bacterium]